MSARNSDFDIENFPTSETAKRMLSRISPIYDRSYVGKWIFQVMGLDLDDVRIRFEELRLQAFPETATWGLTYWEIRYGITPSETQTIEQRRRAVLAKRNAREPINPKKVEYIIETMTGFKAVVTENVADYTFSVEIYSDGTDFDFDAVFSKLKRIKPSHQRMMMYLATDIGINIAPSREVYHFPYRLAGTYPQTNIVGVLQDVNIEIESSGSGTPFEYPLTGEHRAGTLPQTNIIAVISPAGVDIETATEATPFEYALTGEHAAGTYPQTNIAAAITQADISAETEAEAYSFPYQLTGMEPDVNMVAAISGNNVSAAVETSSATINYPLCGDDDS